MIVSLFCTKGTVLLATRKYRDLIGFSYRFFVASHGKYLIVDIASVHDDCNSCRFTVTELAEP